MHMADALLSPAIGVAMTAVSVGAISYAAIKLKKDDDFDEKKIPLMGVMGAFVFAGQMINFTIPGTGSSGHIGGGILLAAILGSCPALLTISAVLIIQCLFFADGGLLALGANIFNMGVLPAMLVYPLIYKPIISVGLTPKRITVASILTVIIGLQLGSFSVVLETLLSGITALPFTSFVLLMQPIHLAIGLVEGIVTALVLCFIYNMRPETLQGYTVRYREYHQFGNSSSRKVVLVMLMLAIITGAGLSLFASAFPDGLEWAVAGVSGNTEPLGSSVLHQAVASVQETSAIMPDYDYKNPSDGFFGMSGTGLSGVVGGGLTLLLALMTGTIIHFGKHKKS